MQTKTIDIKTPDGICDAYIAHPNGAGPFPAVLFYMDAFGVREYLHEMIERLAKEGFYVLLPNLFYRHKRAPVLNVKFPVTTSTLGDAVEQFLPLLQGYTPELGMRDAEVFLRFLSEQKQANSGPVGTTGYCMGGTMSIRTAAGFPNRVAAAASFHAGGLVTDASDSPHRLLKNVRAELYFAHADNDPHMTPQQNAILKKALKENSLQFEDELFPGAAHGFTMADLPMYNEAALRKHWEKLVALFKRRL